MASPYSAYCSISKVVASDSPIRPRSQPMALPGRRLVITSPAPAYTPTVTARMTSPPIRFAPTRPAFSPSTTSAATSSSTVNPATDQAATRTQCR